MRMNTKIIVPLIILGVGILLWIYLRNGGNEEVEESAERMNKRLNYWQYRFSLWWGTEKIKRSYKYLTCKFCGEKFRIAKNESNPVCPHCKTPLSKKKGKKKDERS